MFAPPPLTVNANDVVLVVEELGRECLAQFCLSRASGAREEEGRRAPRGAHASTGTNDGVRDAAHRLVLPHDPLREVVREVEEALAIRCRELGHGDAGPAGDDFGDLCTGGP